MDRGFGAGVMSPTVATHRSRARAALVVAVTALALGGCLRREASDVTGAIAAEAAVMTEAEKRASVEQYARAYDKSPGDKRVSLTYARLLRDLGQINRAIAVLQTAAVRHPNDREVASAYGKALADGGRFAEAQEVLSRAHTPDRPDWRVLSAQGAISDQLGRHAEAQQYYQAALQLQPNDPNTLSNLGLSHALSNRLAEAEQVMRQAVAQRGAGPRVRGNLALVLALQGKFKDSEAEAAKDLSPADAAANIAFVRAMTAQRNSWAQVKAMERGGPQRQAAR
jgi:Flp pilus assembly protein TadD